MIYFNRDNAEAIDIIPSWLILLKLRFKVKDKRFINLDNAEAID